MSGIAGILNLNGEPVHHDTVARMCLSIRHRGPHRLGVWTDGNVGLGHVLLHTTEESIHEEQPHGLDGFKAWITADARIDDRSGLIDRIEARTGTRNQLKRNSDAELLLRAYQLWGADCVNQVVGDFAAVIWDGYSRTLVCLRDHLGIKPLYYAQVKDHFVFGSEVKAILASGLIPRTADEGRIADYLVTQLEGVDRTGTFFKHIVRLPPAHRLTCTPEKIAVDRYWSLHSVGDVRYAEEQAYIDGFRDIHSKAVISRLRGGKRVGSMLSGGMDSSSIVAVARDHLREAGEPDLSTISFVNSSDLDCRETFHINQVLNQGGLDPYTIEVSDTAQYFEDIYRLLEKTDDLFDYLIHLLAIIYLAASRSGKTALLDGVDGDLVMGQPGNHVAYLLQRYRWISAFREARATRRFYHRFKGNLVTDLFSAARTAFTPQFLRALRQRHRQAQPEKRLAIATRETIINMDFAREIDLLERLDRLAQRGDRKRKIDLRAQQISALSHPNLAAAIERYDRVASMCSIEPRHPILDRRLVEYCAGLPWQQKMSGGWTKLIARKAMTHLLPEPVVWRLGWEHLGPQITERLWTDQISRIAGSVLDDTHLISRYIDTATVRTACDRYAQKGAGWDETEGWMIVEAWSLIHWQKKWNDGTLVTACD